ncbi:MAG: hypothetical protein JST89_03965 [Cyanobacteria bacterium SZAS-4]|nr:hypothetical protein [Cyanobacteria bacterium SZAS-4]
MAERNLGEVSHAPADSQQESSIAGAIWQFMQDHPKTTAILGVGLMGTAVILTHGEAATAMASGAKVESQLPSAALGFAKENGSGTLAGFLDDTVKSGRYTFKDGVMMPAAEGAFKPVAELPSTLLKADASPGTIAGSLDRLVMNGDYKVVGDPKSPFFILQPVTAPNQAEIRAAEAAFWKGK